jgi:hypothetical protein
MCVGMCVVAAAIAAALVRCGVLARSGVEDGGGVAWAKVKLNVDMDSGG